MAIEVASVAIIVPARVTALIAILPIASAVPIASIEVGAANSWCPVVGIAATASHSRPVVATNASGSCTGSFTTIAAPESGATAVASASGSGTAAIATTCRAAITATSGPSTTAAAIIASACAATASTVLTDEIDKVCARVGRLDVERRRGVGHGSGQDQAAGESRHGCQADTHHETSISF
jgi:hypothetical protein